MDKGIIITLPSADYATEYLSQFSGEIIKKAAEKGVNVKKLSSEQANRKEFEKTVNKLDYRMIIFNGHGSEKSIKGNNETLIRSGDNDHVLKERITYARSCHAGKSLGRYCMRNSKQGCFIGYDRPFMFYTDKNWISVPGKDRVAPLFLKPSNLVPISIIKGNSALHAHENGRKQILKNINKTLRKGGRESFLFAAALWNNYAGQILAGNSSAVL